MQVEVPRVEVTNHKSVEFRVEVGDKSIVLEIDKNTGKFSEISRNGYISCSREFLDKKYISYHEPDGELVEYYTEFKNYSQSVIIGEDNILEIMYIDGDEVDDYVGFYIELDEEFQLKKIYGYDGEIDFKYRRIYSTKSARK